MTAKLRYVLPFLVTALPLAAVSAPAMADPPKGDSGYTWPSHYDFFLPYGQKDGGPVYAKPGYKGVNLTLTCQEAKGLLEMKGYRDIEDVSCSGSTYRFKVSRIEGRLMIELDPRTGDIVGSRRL